MGDLVFGLSELRVWLGIIRAKEDQEVNDPSYDEGWRAAEDSL